MKDNLHEEILRQLSLIRFDRSKTIIENENNNLKTTNYCKSFSAAQIKSLLFQAGFFTIPRSYWTWDCKNYKDDQDAYKDAALSAMRYLTNLLFNYINYGTLDSFFVVNVVGDKSGGEWKFNSFGQDMIDKLKEQLYRPKEVGLGVDETQIRSRNIYNTFVLKDFYFNYPKLTTNLDVFEGGPWNFLNMFFGSSPGNVGSQINIPNAVSSIINVNMFKQPVYNRIPNPRDEVYITVGDQYKASNETNWAPYASAYHIVAPIVSFILNFFPPAGPVIGSAIEVIDAAIYEFYNEDEYLAGFTLGMALIPFSELGLFRSYLKLSKSAKSGEEALNIMSKKLINGAPETLTSVEKQLYKEITDPKTIIPRLKKVVVETLDKAVKSKGAKFVVGLVDEMARGVGWNKAIMRNIYKIWGVSYSFDWWAYKNLGKCSATFNWDELTAMVGIIKRKYKGKYAVEYILNDRINYLIEVLNPQPYTNSPQECEAFAQIKLLQEMQKLQLDKQKMFNNLLISTFTTMLENNSFMSVKYKNRYEIEVEMLQSMLYQIVGAPYIGVQYKVKNFYKNKKGKTSSSDNPLERIISINSGGSGDYQNSIVTISNVSSLKKIDIINTIPGDQIVDTIRPMGKKEVDSKKIIIPTSFKLKLEWKDGTIQETEMIKNNINYEYLALAGGVMKGQRPKSNIWWGHYDWITEEMVKLYQNKYGLQETGIVNKETLEQLISSLKSNLIIKNINNLEIDKEEEMNQLFDLAKTNLIENYETTQIEPDPNRLTPQQQKDSTNIVNFWMTNNFSDSLQGQLEKLTIIDTTFKKN